MNCRVGWAPEGWPWSLGGAVALTWACGFGFYSLYWPKVPFNGIFFLFLLPIGGLELAFRRCIVLPFFSKKNKCKCKVVTICCTYVRGKASP